jgi:REP element-mobilizing transposase RayT
MAIIIAESKMSIQLVIKAIAKPGRGGKRKGAGRKPKGTVAGVSHAARPFHEGAQPVLVTVRFVRGLPSMRELELGAAIAEGIRKARSRTFQVIHFSIQGDHLHLVVEAGSQRSLSRGMQGMRIRHARRINRMLGRSGKVFTDRYHARALATPREVRNAIRYVVSNWLKHVDGARGFDPYSSGRWFDGWTTAQPVSDTPCPTARSRTWLGGHGWRRRGLISPSERPGKARDL